MDILENIVIGNFIYGLGNERGARYGRMQCEPIAVELLQQTPLDTCLGDVLIANATFVRLIEFKRELNKDEKEKAKFWMLRTALDSPSLSHLVPVSRQIHWYVFTNFNKTKSSIVVPYLDLETPDGDRDLEKFIEEVADGMAGPGMNQQELRDVSLYIQALARYCGSGKGVATTGGLLFTVNAQGKAQYLPVKDVRELAMTPQLVLKQRLILKQELELKLKVEQERLVQKRSLGLTL